jgi:hypothetical protein
LKLVFWETPLFFPLDLWAFFCTILAAERPSVPLVCLSFDNYSKVLNITFSFYIGRMHPAVEEQYEPHNSVTQSE